MNYLDEVPEHLVEVITSETDISELRYLRAKYRGARDVWVRLAIDERIKCLKVKMVNS